MLKGFEKIGLRICPELIAYKDNKKGKEADFGEIGAESGVFTAETAGLKVSLDAKVREGEGVFDCDLAFKVYEGENENAGVGIRFDIGKWSRENYVFVPAAVYAGNRFECLPYDYPPLMRDEKYHKLDQPTYVTDVPRLNAGEGESKFEINTGDMATPCFGFYLPELKKGFLVFTEQGNELGNFGFTFSEGGGRRSASLLISSPCVREKWYRWPHVVESEERGAKVKAGDEIEMGFKAVSFDAERVQDLYDKFFEMRKSVVRPTGEVKEIPFSRAWEILEEKYNRDNWIEENGYYAVGTTWQDNICQNWQIGWVGGCMATEALIGLGTDETRERAFQALDTIINETQAKSGFFYGMWEGGENLWGDGFDEEHPANMHMTRKSADALYFFLKQFDLLRKIDIDIPEEWKDSVRNLADAFVGLWGKYGQIGQFVDVETGDIVIGGTTSAGILPAGLAEASEFYGDGKYLNAAEEIAEHYYKRDVKNGVTNAGPGEILQDPDSESAFGVLEGFAVLYEMTGKEKWLKCAEEMAGQCSSWVVSYDYEFPRNSIFGNLGMKTRGTVFANVQNKHSAPGICTLSGDSLLKIYRATGDKSYLELLSDIAGTLPQYMSREDRQINELKPGWINERVNMSDWEGFEMVGNVFYGSCWPEVSLMLSIHELPGIYADMDEREIFVFDNIKAEVIDGVGEKFVLRLENPTNFSAEVTIYKESGEERREPLGFNAFLGLERVVLNAGEVKEIILKD